MGQKHGGQTRWLNRQDCVHCGTISSQRCCRCNCCGVRHSAPRTSFQDRRSGRRSSTWAATSSELAASAPGEPWTTARFRTALSGTSLCLKERSSCSLNSAGRRRWHSRALWSLDTPRLGQKVSKEPRAVTNPGLTLVACSLLKSRRVSTGTPKKKRVQLWESGQISVLLGRFAEQQERRSRGSPTQ